MFPLEREIKIVIILIALHNFTMINTRTYIEFKPCDDDQGYFHQI